MHAAAVSTGWLTADNHNRRTDQSCLHNCHGHDLTSNCCSSSLARSCSCFAFICASCSSCSSAAADSPLPAATFFGRLKRAVISRTLALHNMKKYKLDIGCMGGVQAAQDKGGPTRPRRQYIRLCRPQDKAAVLACMQMHNVLQVVSAGCMRRLFWRVTTYCLLHWGQRDFSLSQRLMQFSPNMWPHFRAAGR